MVFNDICSFACQVFLDEQDQLQFLMLLLGVYVKLSYIK